MPPGPLGATAIVNYRMICLVRPRILLPLVAAVALASCGDEEPAEDWQRPAPMSGVAAGCKPEPVLRQHQVLLACESFSRGRELQIRTERDSGGRDGCLEIYGMGDGQSRACGYVPYKRDPVPSSPITLDSVNQVSEARPVEVYGSASTEVAEVTIVSKDRHGERERDTATLLRVVDQNALAEAELAEPFGYFVAELPSDSMQASATARAADGHPLKRLNLRVDLYRPPFVYARE